MSAQRLGILGCAAFCLVACARQPASGVRATGEPLSIYKYTKQHSETRDEKVADIKVKDTRGNTVTTGAVYEEREYKWKTHHWRPRQGDEFISDEDLYWIANDQAKAETAREYRLKGRRLMIIGAAFASVGLAVTGATMPVYLRTQNKAAGAAMVAGSIVFAGGAYPLSLGIRRTSAEGHPFEEPVAKESVDAYNRSLRALPVAAVEPVSVRGVSVSGRF